MKLIRFQNSSFILINLRNSLKQTHIHCVNLNNSIHKMQNKRKIVRKMIKEIQEIQNKIFKIFEIDHRDIIHL